MKYLYLAVSHLKLEVFDIATRIDIEDCIEIK